MYSLETFWKALSIYTVGHIALEGKTGVHHILVVAQNFQWTSFTAKSGFQMMTTEHGFSLKSGFTKIWCTPVFPLHVYLESSQSALSTLEIFPAYNHKNMGKYLP